MNHAHSSYCSTLYHCLIMYMFYIQVRSNIYKNQFLIICYIYIYLHHDIYIHVCIYIYIILYYITLFYIYTYYIYTYIHVYIHVYIYIYIYISQYIPTNKTKNPAYPPSHKVHRAYGAPAPRLLRRWRGNRKSHLTVKLASVSGASETLWAPAGRWWDFMVMQW